MSSLCFRDSSVISQRLLPTRFVGRMNNGTTTMPIVASKGLFVYIVTSATVNVAKFCRMLVQVPVSTLCTPPISLMMAILAEHDQFRVHRRIHQGRRCRDQP
ncbi:MAG: hypothetical protein V9E84_08015 [Trichococcus flocculiformis]